MILRRGYPEHRVKSLLIKVSVWVRSQEGVPVTFVTASVGVAEWGTPRTAQRTLYA